MIGKSSKHNLILRGDATTESIFALGNGMMGQRANFEETYSGDTLQGTYVARHLLP